MPIGIRKFIAFAFLAYAVLLAMTQASRAQQARSSLTVAVDLTRAPQKILHTHLEIPVQPGVLTLEYPQWIPGEHMPDGPIINVVGLKFAAAGKTIPWRRDLVDMFGFHLDIPQGVSLLDVDFDFLLSAPTSGFSAGASATAFLDALSWNQLVLYPKGSLPANITVTPAITIPDGWQFGTALKGAKRNGNTISFSPVSLEELVDSPVLSGRYFRAIKLTPNENPSHEIDIAADSAAALAMSPETETHFHQLVLETGALFGARHYRDYHFLLTLSDHVAHFGLEHHESSDDRTDERSLIDDSARTDFADLLPHEFVHSWNGKYRRPAGLATPDYQQPMKDDLLWVYEGLTEYLGEVLTTRSGLRPMDLSREYMADLVSTYDHRPGRSWRPLQDTADAAVFLYDSGYSWSNWRRGTDFYDEGTLFWMNVDDTIRRLTKDKKSLNDFCKSFEGPPGGEPSLKPYTFEDVVAALNGVAPYDWAGFLRAHLDSTDAKTPDEAIENAGWKLVYNEQPNSYGQTEEGVQKQSDQTLTLGFTVGDEGVIGDVDYGGLAFKAGIGPGMKIMVVNSQQFSLDRLREAIDAAKSDTAPIQLTVQNGVDVRGYSLDYHKGLLYPHLERDESKPDYLTEILTPLAP
jgi:predicted metalloprotease with PDZ domain